MKYLLLIMVLLILLASCHSTKLPQTNKIAYNEDVAFRDTINLRIQLAVNFLAANFKVNSDGGVIAMMDLLDQQYQLGLSSVIYKAVSRNNTIMSLYGRHYKNIDHVQIPDSLQGLSYELLADRFLSEPSSQRSWVAVCSQHPIPDRSLIKLYGQSSNDNLLLPDIFFLFIENKRNGCCPAFAICNGMGDTLGERLKLAVFSSQGIVNGNNQFFNLKSLAYLEYGHIPVDQAMVSQYLLNTQDLNSGGWGAYAKTGAAYTYNADMMSTVMGLWALLEYREWWKKLH